MARRILRVRPPSTPALDADFARIREEFDVLPGFPDDVEETAAAAATRPPTLDGRVDMRDLEFFTVDPPGSMDLDQAMVLDRSADGYRVVYAIADVGAFVDRGGVVEAEAFRRGVTVYCPDLRAPLYPTSLSEGAASLLPDQDRPAIVFTIELDGTGLQTSAKVDRALVRSRRKLDYAGLQDAGAGLLQTIGELRRRAAVARHVVELNSPNQTIVADPSRACGYRLELERRLPVEDWNAQISLLTGMAAASIMLEQRVGLLRTMAGVDEYRLAALRRTALALGVAWPDDVAYDEFVRGLDPADPHQAVLLVEAHGVMGRAGYTAFAGAPPEQPEHAALAAPYAHTTAPMRRLCDRYVLELLAELCAGGRPAAAEVTTLERLPQAMTDAETRAGQLERALVDDVEVRLLEHSEGSVFDAAVVEIDARGAKLQMADPPIRARLHSDPLPALGSSIRVRLVRADPASRSLQFALA